MMVAKQKDFKVPTYRGEQFTWSRGVAGNSIGIAEASDLDIRTHEFGGGTRVWRDSCDVGFEVISHRTGRVKLFTFAQVLKDAEGDIIAWVFESADDSDIDIHILND